MTPPLTALRIEWHEADDRHDEITVGMSVLADVCERPSDYPSISDAECADAAVFGAGILGRIAVQAFREIQLEAREHRCQTSFRGEESGRVYVDGCSVTGPESLLEPRTKYGEDVPALWIVVPRGHVTAWRERINTWLEQISNDLPNTLTNVAARKATA